MTQSRTIKPTPGEGSHRRMGERAATSIIESPWFKVFVGVSQVFMGVIITLGSLVLASLRDDIKEMKATNMLYLSERGNVNKSLESFESFQRDSLIMRAQVQQRLTSLETKESQRDKEVAEIRAVILRR